jgi:hypothetical protein
MPALYHRGSDWQGDTIFEFDNMARMKVLSLVKEAYSIDSKARR